MAERLDFEKVKEEVKKIVAEVAELPPEQIKEDARFAEDLGVDSMQALEISASIEKKYKITIPEEEIPNLRSLKDIYQLVEKLLKN